MADKNMDHVKIFMGARNKIVKHVIYELHCDIMYIIRNYASSGLHSWRHFSKTLCAKTNEIHDDGGNGHEKELNT
jgi:hypothetical protein